jgi:hypothetical protein
VDTDFTKTLPIRRAVANATAPAPVRATPMPSLFFELVDTSIGDVAVESHGRGARTLLLWVASPLLVEDWNVLVAFFGETHRIVVIEEPAVRPRPEQGAAVALEVIRHYGLCDVDWFAAGRGAHVGMWLGSRGNSPVARLAVALGDPEGPLVPLAPHVPSLFLTSAHAPVDTLFGELAEIASHWLANSRSGAAR